MSKYLTNTCSFFVALLVDMDNLRILFAVVSQQAMLMGPIFRDASSGEHAPNRMASDIS